MIQIKIGNEFLDIDQSQNVALQKKFADLADPSARGASVVYDINIPITQKNKRILEYIDSPYTILKELSPKRAQVYADGILIADGALTVKSVNNEFYVVTIENPENDWLTFFENNTLNCVNWPDELCQGQAMIATLDRSGLTDKYCTPLVDYGNLREIDINVSSIYYADIFPAVFVYPLLKQLFKQAGYTLVSDFFEKDKNEYLCIPFGREYLPLKDPSLQTEDVDYVEAEASPGLNNLPPASTYTLKIDNILKNKNGYIDTSSLPDFKFVVDNEWEDDVYGPITCGNFRGLDVEVFLEIQYTTYATLTFVPLVVRTFLDSTLVNTQTFNIPTATPTDVKYKHIISNVKGGQSITITLTSTFGSMFQSSTAKLFITRLKLSDKHDTEGLRFYLKDTLPDVNCYDFLKDILTIFNLYAITDNNNKTVALVQYDELRKNRFEYEDWRQRCSRENNVLEINSHNLPARTVYKYASADDYHCATYEQANGYPYGFYIHNNPNPNNNGDTYEVAANIIRPTVMGFFKVLWYVPQYWSENYTDISPGDPVEMNTGIGVRLLKYVVATEKLGIAPIFVKSEYGAPTHIYPSFKYPTAVFEVDYQAIKKQYSPLVSVTSPEPLPFDHHNLKFDKMASNQAFPQGLFLKYHEFWQVFAMASKKATLRVKIYPQDYFSPEIFSKIKLINITIDNSTYTAPAYLNEIKTYIPSLNEFTLCEFVLLT